MKYALKLFLFVSMAAVSALAVAANEHANHGAISAQSNHASVAMVDGVVKKIDKTSGKVTLSHGPLTNLGMPAMTMAFNLKETTWVDQMRVGDKIRFVADEVNGALTVVNFERQK